MASPETKRNLYRGVVFGLLFLTWMIFSGLFDAFHLTLGVISCGIITWMSSDLLFEDRTIPLSARLRQGVRLGGYCFWLLWQIVLSNLHLFRLAFSSPKALQPHIVRYETKLKTDFEKYLLASSITLTPGTVTIKIMGDRFYVHAISDIAAEGLDGEMERRIARIFAMKEAKQALEAPTS
ncbi:MAG: Na+/H+ antiporter subunit E [Verrucomicrobiales bacterium]|jgi:multicomponent Na+:H+ antiporter subunit E|nr:Na+/H+ antiporter subunit E [bacterium]MDF2377360.1 Na+/H+ antiporter subunit E [Verrucomicrobiales bacterium]